LRVSRPQSQFATDLIAVKNGRASPEYHDPRLYDDLGERKPDYKGEPS